MSTATAYAQRPITFRPQKVVMDLVKAMPEDFKKVKGYDENGFPVYTLRTGMVYWLYSHSENVISPIPYIVDENTDAKEIKEYLDQEMIYIAKYPFNDL